MSIEDLLKPRYKVIADYPDSECFVGTIIEQSGDRYRDELGFLLQQTNKPEHYPVIFKELGWWEMRKVEDMPEYVKQTGMVNGADEPVPDICLKVKKHFNAGNGEWRDDSIHIFCADSYISTLKNCSYSYSVWLPATKEDYETYLNTTQNKNT